MLAWEGPLWFLVDPVSFEVLCWPESILCRLREFSIGLRSPRLVALCQPERTLFRSERDLFRSKKALRWSESVSVGLIQTCFGLQSCRYDG